ncbi:ribosome biogenesis protein [Caldivirga sp. UBA161]|uniref:ribosome biogenesis protein n=1 Tax=Caldivirga sp. UBA161 TaxID=1915569 RepID=UPI0025C62839|nr:ribosome biogenesis protein [Caldivirga sp. UBA161]
MLKLILVDAALEPIPPELRNNKDVIKAARRLGRDPNYMPLDKALHFKAMGRLKGKESRGRPDIVHKFLLDSLNSLLARRGMLTVYIHTVVGKVIEVAPGERPPQNYFNFLGLVEQLFKYGSVPPSGKWLLRFMGVSINELIESMSESLIILLERDGEPIKVTELAKLIIKNGGAVVMVGGMPKGSSEVARALARRIFSLANGEPLTTSHTVNSLIVSIESELGLI